MGIQESDPTAESGQAAAQEPRLGASAGSETVEKDAWYKLGIIATIAGGALSLLSAILVALIGALVTVSTAKNALEVQKQTAEIAKHNDEEMIALNKLDLSIKGDYDRKTALAQTQNSLTERASAVEKFLPHLAAGDPGKVAAEIMIARLGYPELTLQIAKSEGDLNTMRIVNSDPRFLQSVSDQPQLASLPRSFKKEYRAAIQDLQAKLRRDQTCLNGIWFDNNPGDKKGDPVEWSFNLDDFWKLSIIRTPQAPTGQALMTRMDERWEGTLEFFYTGTDSVEHSKAFERFQMFPQLDPSGGCTTRIRTSNGFYFSNHKR